MLSAEFIVRTGNTNRVGNFEKLKLAQKKTCVMLNMCYVLLLKLLAPLKRNQITTKPSNYEKNMPYCLGISIHHNFKCAKL